MKTELFINNINVDLYKDESIKFIFSIADVKNIGGRNTTYSKSLSIPGTASNNSLFNYIFDISSDHNFNPNKKASAYILVDSILVIDGYLQLISIDYDLKSHEIIYNVVIYASNFDLYKNIGDKLVEDLDYSNVTYNFSQSEIESSWLSSYVPNTREYVVPLIDYGYGWQQNRISDQNSPILNTQLYPATYVKGLVDRIIKDAGYTYTSNFLTSDFFKRLCLPVYSVAKQNAKVQIDLDLTISADTSNGPNYIGYNIELQRYKDGNWNTEVLYNSGSNFLASGAVVRIEDSKQFFTSPGEKWRVLTSAVGANFLRLSLCKNGTLKFTYPSPISGNTYVGNPSFSFSILGGSYLIWPFHEDSVLPFYDPYNTWDNTGGIWEHTVPNLNYGVYLPKNIKQIDLLKSIISMFNLYIDIDKNNNKNLIIEPRDDYYRLNTRILDWSEKIDISKPIKEELLSELQSKSLLFSYKEDRDYLNSDYKNITKKIYGEYKTSFDNDFISGENNISVIFSPTPVQNITDSDTIIIPKIYKFDATNNTFEQTDGNLRILYNAGKTYVEPTEKYYINYSAGTYLNTSILTEIYPYVSTNDSYSASTLTLNWGDNQFEYFNSTGVTDNNLYNLYWSNYYKEISDKRSKLITAYFNLTPLDISSFKFNDLIYVEALKNYFRINKIEYDALGDSISKVELISVVSVDGFISKGRVTNTIKKADGKGRIGINIGKNNISDFALSVGNGNTINSSNRNIIISGNKNEIDGFNFNNVSVFGDVNRTSYTGSSVFIFGNYNTANTENTLILNASGSTILTGNNVSIIGLNNLTITGTNQDNTVHLPKVIIHSGLTINGININQYWTASTGSNSLVRYPELGSVMGSTKGIITAGQNNTGGTAGSYQLIAQGFRNNTNYAFSMVLNGLYNSALSTKALVGSGFQNLASGFYSTIINGRGNSGATAYATIINGRDNYISGNTDTFGLIIQGRSNKIQRGYFSSIFNGDNNLIKDSTFSNIVAGNDMIISGYSVQSSIINGDENRIYGLGYHSLIGNGVLNIIKNNSGVIHNYNTIINGFINTIIANKYSTIINGRYNLINNCNNSTIVNGINNNINNSTGITLLSISNYTANSLSNTVIADRLILRSLTGTGYQYVVADANGQLSLSAITSSGSGSTVNNYYNNGYWETGTTATGIKLTGWSSSVSTIYSIHAGYQGSLSNGNYAGIFAGSGNTNFANFGTIIGGQYNDIDGISFGSILNSRYSRGYGKGDYQQIINSNTCVISGDVSFSSIINSQNSSIYIVSSTTQPNVILIGQSGYTHRDQSDVVVLPNLYTRKGRRTTYTIIDSTYTATTNDYYIRPKASGTYTIYLPKNPYDGMELIIKDYNGSSSSNIITINGNGFLIDGSTRIDLDNNYKCYKLIFGFNKWDIISVYN